MNQEYIKWEKQVRDALQELKKDLDENEMAKSLYNGFYIWDSKFIVEPEVMFIGINPGDGNPNNNRYVKVKPAENMSYLEYWDENNTTYTLARETLEVFEKAGYSKDALRVLLNEQSVKTNFYYIITKNQGEITKCLNSLGRGRFKKYWLQSFHWTGELIEIIKPKVIICEGKNSFDEISGMMECDTAKWEDDCAVAQVPERKLVIIGYKRNYSNIVNKEKLAELIREFVKN